MAVSSHAGPLKPYLPSILSVSDRSYSRSMAWSLRPRFCCSAANKRSGSLLPSCCCKFLLGVLVKHTRVTEAKCHILLDKITTVFKAWPVKKLIYVGKAQFIDFVFRDFAYDWLLSEELRKDLVFVQHEHELPHVDELLGTCTESIQDGLMYCSRQFSDLMRNEATVNLGTFRRRRASRVPIVPREVSNPDDCIWNQVTTEVRNSKKGPILGLVELETSAPVKTAQNSSQHAMSGRPHKESQVIRTSFYSGSHSIQATTFNVEARIDQVEKQIGEELHEIYTAELGYCKEGTDATRKVLLANDLSLGKEFDVDMLSYRAKGINGKSPVANNNHVLEEAQTDCEQNIRLKLCSIFDKVLVVDNVTIARKVVHMLTHQYRDLIHACDTEVSKIDAKQETPVGHGEMICFSIYSGEEVHYGNGKSCVWVDVLDGGGKDILAEFAPFFEDPSIKKVWHNYSFDCHVVENYGIRLSGFHADTMHMARLWDSSRQMAGGYSLEALTGDPKVMYENRIHPDEDLMGKISMKTIFGRRKIKKDGSAGKIISIPPVEDLQREERQPWICYSSLDSMSTLKLYHSLKSKLSKMPWLMNGKRRGSMLKFYENYWRPFGELLVQMETEGVLVDRTYLAEVEKVAIAEQKIAANCFRSWASRYCRDAKYMNVGSDTQLRQLLFGGVCNRLSHTIDYPWFIGGDFNIFLEVNERVGGDQEVKYIGSDFTWSNRQGSTGIFSRLDRILINRAALDSYSEAFYETYQITTPDIVPSSHNYQEKHQFHFFNMCVRNQEIKGTSMFQVVSKLKKLKKSLREVHGDVHQNVVKIQQELRHV
ncbi:hypothetical protein Cgig2_017198 [Carnegiea gigantea]|uniref:3'-5' exonuclease domain-containing protein n=1 Tax=Carnegiea gigantea TaxID=171969 RepID=A0A9Q1QK82_9CARY|nr:hypothetical protein Cgig2_017198 [Carnegiea gigantea]